MNVDAPLTYWNRVSSIFKTRAGEIGSVTIGIATFGALTNWKILNPLFVRWLYWGDPSAGYLGWQFFRKTALLQFPIGASPNYGVGFASSIMYTDSVPLIAIPLKYISFLLPTNFQYFGLWILGGFVLQAWFAWKILARFSKSLTLNLFGVFLITNAPIFVYRLVHDGSGHIGFIGQFLLLWAINNYLEPKSTQRNWLKLICLTPLISLGLIPMVMSLYVFWLIKNCISDATSTSKKLLIAATKLIGSVFLMLGVMWVCGALMVSDPSDSGFGIYRTSLTSLFDPKAVNSFSFSKLLPDIGSIPGTQEGFAFLGTSVIGIVLISCIVIFKIRHPLISNTYAPLVLGSAALGVFSLSNRISISQREIFTYPIPEPIMQLIGPFRSSGRFIWPIVYLIMIYGLIYLSLIIKKSAFWGFGLLILLLSTQLYESATIYSHTRMRFAESEFTAQLVSSKWDQIAQNYDHLIVVPPLNNDPSWFELSLLANKWDMTTNATYLGRIDLKKFESAATSAQINLETFQFDSRTMYVITNYPLNPMNQIILEKYGPTSLGHTKAFSLDGLTVIAP